MPSSEKNLDPWKFTTDFAKKILYNLDNNQDPLGPLGISFGP
jgi:hypothetical protein